MHLRHNLLHQHVNQLMYLDYVTSTPHMPRQQLLMQSNSRHFLLIPYVLHVQHAVKTWREMEDGLSTEDDGLAIYSGPV